jgi:hypothetical protein
MRKRPVLTALVIFAVTGAVNHSQNLAEARQGDLIKNLSGMMTTAAHVNNAWQQESLIHKVGTDAYSGMGPVVRPGGYQQESMPGGQSRPTGEYKAGSPGNESQYGSNPSSSYLQRESSGSSSSKGPYGGAVYGGPPTTPSADPMIKELSRDPSMR